MVQQGESAVLVFVLVDHRFVLVDHRYVLESESYVQLERPVGVLPGANGSTGLG